MKPLVPVDGKRKDWPRIAADAINRSQEKSARLTAINAATATGIAVIDPTNSTVLVRSIVSNDGSITVTNGDGQAGDIDLSAGVFGYTTGDGGTVTQATSKSTAVTLNKDCGRITMNNATLAADTSVSFTLNNSGISATDLLVLNHASAGTFGAYLLSARCGNGAATISVRNVTGGSLGEAIVLGFAVVQAVTS